IHTDRIFERFSAFGGDHKDAVGIFPAVKRFQGRILQEFHTFDGLRFEIFKRINITSKIVFTTAFDEFVLNSFDYNNIFYLIKPIGKIDLKKAFEKYDMLKSSEASLDFTKVFESLGISKTTKASRIVIESESSYTPINTKDIALIETDFKSSVVYLTNGKKYPCSMNLKKFEATLDPDKFIRVSRQCIANVDCILSINKSVIGKPKIILKPGCAISEIEISKDKIDKIIDSL
ncbi:MAG: LytTR family DNA-binding domain-containing protein, partial [Bacteroidales bacterium]|nr:LytTR family DNA-binding domain-containing protein [Bacteroidales bacterium]